MIDKLGIDKLNELQTMGIVHPYTCDRRATECEVNTVPRDYSKDGILIATEEGWVCPCGMYRQNISSVPSDEVMEMFREQIKKFTNGAGI